MVVTGPRARGRVDPVVQRRDLRRMKVVATALVGLAALVYVLTAAWLADGAPAWVGYLNAAAAAGTIGGLADWFAVTALFRHPLGLPIPHTAIVPRKKDQLGDTLSDFVAENFLSRDLVADKVRRTDPARAVSRWLADPANAAQVSGEVAVALRGVVEVLDDKDIKNAVEFALMRRLAAAPVSAPLGQLLEEVVRDGTHHELVDVIVSRTCRWLESNRTIVVETINGRAPAWSPAFVDEIVSERIYAEVLRVARSVRDDPTHETRQTVDRLLHDLASDMRSDPTTIARVQRAKDNLITHPRARTILDEVWSSQRQSVLDMSRDPDSALQAGLAGQLVTAAETVLADDDLAERINSWAADAAAHLVSGYSAQLTSIITETIEAWDEEETTSRIELSVGRDLQYVRINGFAVGALVGVLIHAATVAVF
jgi:uncharacterized membrane-anchored protein YjiN (DUF445 family)